MTVIVTKRLLLNIINSQPSLNLLREHVRWLNDPDVVRYSEQRHRIHSIRSQVCYIDSFIWPNTLCSITMGGKPIGTISAMVDTHNSVADIGILIGDKTQWGKGIGTEAWEAMMSQMFEMGVRKVTGGAMAINVGMLAIFKKTGMFREGERKDHFIFREDNGFNEDGGKRLIDLVQWAKFRK